MKKLWNLIISMKTMVIFTLLFAFASAMGTFIENDYGTETAWATIYTTWWFTLIMVVLALNLIGNIFRFKLYQRSKLGAFIFHTGFLVILLGAAITRYVGYEGVMHIREGGTSDNIRTNYNYIQIDATKNGKTFHKDHKLLLSKISSNDFNIKLKVDHEPAQLKFIAYLPYAKQVLAQDPKGEAMIEMMVVAPMQQPETLILKDHSTLERGGMRISLNQKEGDISIFTKEGKLYFKSTKPIHWMKMADRSSGTFEANKVYPFETKRLYDLGSIKIVPREAFAKATVKLINQPDKTPGGQKMKSIQKEALLADLTYAGHTRRLTLFGYGKGSLGEPVDFKIDDTHFHILWGAKLFTLPFSLTLKDFELKRYPGSMSPSSYSSRVVLNDPKHHVTMPYHIYMNHVLDYRNYRFFQSSYDMDEKGTILSVNHDPGKIPTYIGYLMLAIGFILTLLNPKSRFRKLSSALQKDTLFKAVLFFTLFSLAQPHTLYANDAIKTAQSFQKAHADKFGDLLIQTHDGRIKTLDTFSTEIMYKLHKGTTAYGLNNNQIILGMLTAPQAWEEIPLIRIKHTRLKKVLGLPKDAKYASFSDFFQDKKGYKLASYIQDSVRKPPIKRNEFDRSVIKVDEMLNIMYMIYTGDLFRIIPQANDPSHKWHPIKEAIDTFPPQEAQTVKNLVVNYFRSIDSARKSGNWTQADQALKTLQDYQYKLSSEIIPAKSKLQAEKIFRKIAPVHKLIVVYLLLGLVLLFFVLLKILKPHMHKINGIVKGVQALFILAFIVHTAVLAVRWYVGGHAPWSNAYEAMLYVAWSMGLAGVVFMRYSPIVTALSAIIAGTTLATTFFNEMNPQITNLVPVLKSYWLSIHVSIITASYGFLGLSAILGLFTLILFIIQGKTPNPRIQNSISQTVKLNEMTAIIGLMMMTIGNFIGGVWANESWGRYWSWDPKETWAWISILVYTAVLHLRFIPYFNKEYNFKFSVVTTVAISSIVMTFVGVNYYLSGMHSYAAGEPVPVPKYLYVIVASILAIIVLAGVRRVRGK